MINTAQTQPPKTQYQKITKANETIPPGNTAQNIQNVVLRAGESVADSYIINSLMDKQGNQSNVYLAKKWGKSYVIKIYNNGWHPSPQMQSFLTNVQHPNIARVVEYGEYNGNYYEIYEYFSEGTLEEAKALSILHIQNVIVPSINEGLHELHKNGIVHCDIKPSNLFYADRENKVVIGDCGISGYTDANGKLIDAVRGTPEYAPRVKSLLWSAAMSPAYDYGSFGLVLCKAVLGRSLFAGMSLEEISNSWANGLELPSQISGRIGTLIRGLIDEDEERRWGYLQVKRWCEGEYMRPINRSIYVNKVKEKEIKPMTFGRFDGQMLSVSTLHQLSQAIEQHWSQATRVIKRSELIDFVAQFDKDISKKIKELSYYQDLDAAVFKLLLFIADDSSRIVYCGKDYGTLAEYLKQLSSGRDEIAKRFLLSGMLAFFLRYNKVENSIIEKLESIIKRSGCNDMASILTICYALQGKKTIEVLNKKITTLDDLFPILEKLSIKEIDDLFGNEQFIAWINRMGYEKEIRKMKEIII